MIDSIRQDAILICAIAASNSDLEDAYEAVCDRLDSPRGAAYELALEAWSHVFDNAGCYVNIDAEAEALLQDGWEP